MPGGSSGIPPKKPLFPRPRYMSDEDVAKIVGMIREWPRAPMEWDGIRAEIGKRLLGRKDGSDEGVWSRQALSARPEIKKAYNERTDELSRIGQRDARRKRKPAPEAVIWRQKSEHLEVRIRALESKLAAYEELFRTYNVRKFQGAATEEELTKPLDSNPKRGGGE